MDIAFVCTGNICRSPMAEALLRARLADVSPRLVVGSAGLLFDDRPAERNAIRAMADRGLDITEHRSQIISTDVLSDASLILGMERVHVRKVAELDPALFARSFTLIELVRSAQIVGARRKDQTLYEWATGISRHRSEVDYAHADRISEIIDPMGGSVRQFRACAATIDEQLALLVGLAWPPTPSRDHLVAPAASGGTHADRDRR